MAALLPRLMACFPEPDFPIPVAEEARSANRELEWLLTASAFPVLALGARELRLVHTRVEAIGHPRSPSRTGW